MIELLNVTLAGVDCRNIQRLETAAAISGRGLVFGETKLFTCKQGAGGSAILIGSIESREEYSHFIIKHLARHVSTEFALIIQHDGFVLNPSAWTEEFTEYDYIGAPWLKNSQWIVGNGGFSLRSRRLLQLLSTDTSIAPPGNIPEDWYICVTLRSYLEQQGMRFSPISLAKRFSIEGNDADGVVWSGEFGFHSLQWTDISAWSVHNSDDDIKNALCQRARRIRRRQADV